MAALQKIGKERREKRKPKVSRNGIRKIMEEKETKPLAWGGRTSPLRAALTLSVRKRVGATIQKDVGGEGGKGVCRIKRKRRTLKTGRERREIREKFRTGSTFTGGGKKIDIRLLNR